MDGRGHAERAPGSPGPHLLVMLLGVSWMLWTFPRGAGTHWLLAAGAEQQLAS